MLHRFMAVLAGAIGNVVVFRPALEAISRGVCGPIVVQSSPASVVAAATGFSASFVAVDGASALQPAKVRAAAPKNKTDEIDFVIKLLALKLVFLAGLVTPAVKLATFVLG